MKFSFLVSGQSNELTELRVGLAFSLLILVDSDFSDVLMNEHKINCFFGTSESRLCCNCTLT